MFKFFKKKEPTIKSERDNKQPDSLFSKLKQGLSKTRKSFQSKLGDLLLGKKQIDDELLSKLEEILLSSDVGIAATKQIINNLTNKTSRKELTNPGVLLTSLKSELEDILIPYAKPLEINIESTPQVILMVGINGSGKTTSIGKLAHHFKNQNKKVILAAGDTFRAAAIEQLKAWGDKTGIPVITQKQGADSASVIFDAYSAAKARGCDLLIADTAGRLHTQDNLMQELKKIIKVLKKQDEQAPHEILLTLDASTGQNAINQIEKFKEELGVTGIIITKLDGTAKGGVIFSIAKQCSLPIHYIGIGEKIEDLKPFQPKDFVAALLESEDSGDN